MDPRIAEIAELQRLWDEESDEFESRRRVSKWGERIKERVVDLISTENADAIEDGLVFLEQNPRFFRTGYFKGKVATRMKSVAFSSSQLDRIRKVIFDAIQSDVVGPEFADYARLFPYVGTREMAGKIEEYCHNASGWQRGRCERLLRHWRQCQTARGE